MIPHAKLLKKFVNFNENSREKLKLNDNKSLLVTTAVDQRYRLSAFPSYLKNNVKEQLKLIIKKHICFEANQDGDSPILPQEKPYTSVNFDPKSFQFTIIFFK